MKKIKFTLSAIIVFCLVTIYSMSPSKAHGQIEITPQKNSLPDSVAMILGKSCIGCHDSGGNKLASSKWSYSGWDEYAAKKQAKKADAMCRVLTKGSMPPAKARKEHPEKIPSPEQVKIICNWAASLNKK